MRLKNPGLSARASSGSSFRRDFDAGGAQRRNAGAVDQRIGIAGRIHHAPHARAASASTHGGVRPVCAHGSSVT